ncbi:MAG: 2'-5' RNA ligase family protein [Candidatus Hydrogenedentales bacterium]
MSHAVELVLDDAAAVQVRQCWRSLAEAGLAPYMSESGSLPHVTLNIFDTLDVDKARALLAARAAQTPPLPIDLASFGIFPGESPVLFLEPVVTRELLDLQHELHDALSDIGEGPWPHYLPGNWVPHCTVALEFPPELMGDVIDTCMDTALPIHASASALALVDFPPLTYLAKYPLVTGKQPATFS